MKKVVILLSLLLVFGCARRELETYTVTFDTNGGSHVESETVENGSSATRPISPVKNGYVFDGWYSDLEKDIEYDFRNEVKRNLTLKAKWIKDLQNGVCTNSCNSGYALASDCTCIKDDVKDIKKVETIDKESKPEVNITLSEKNYLMVEGASATIDVIVEPSTKEKVIWSSSDKSVAIVSDGVIKALKKGKTTITASIGDVSSKLNLTVETKDDARVSAVADFLEARLIDKDNNSITYSFNNCNIENTKNTVSSNIKKNITIKNGLVYKKTKKDVNGEITSEYKIKCGNSSKTKTLKHVVKL